MHTTTNTRVIKLGRHTCDSRTWIFPTPALRDLAIRQRYRLLPQCNYLFTWYDVNGWGLTIAVSPMAEPWPRPANYYRSPNAGLYKNPGFDLVNL